MARDERRVTAAENEELRRALRRVSTRICTGCGLLTGAEHWELCRRCYERSQGWRGQLRNWSAVVAEVPKPQDGQGGAEGSGK